MKQSIAIFLLYFLGISLVHSQQLLFVQGNGTSTNSTPELSVQGGVLYVQGGITTTGITPKVINSAAIVIDGGDWENISDADIDVTSPIDHYVPIVGFADLNTTYPSDDLNGGTVHFATGNQKIKGDYGTTFYNLSLDGIGTNIKSLENVNVEVQNQLYLNDEILKLNDNELFVSNSGIGAISRAINGSGGNEPIDLYGNTSLGMGSQNQFSTLEAGMITATNEGRLIRATSAGLGLYLFPLGSSDSLLYRPMEIIISSLDTRYAARLEKNTPNPFSFGIPAPTAINTNFYHLVNCEAGNTGDEIRIYALLSELSAINNGCNPNLAPTTFGIAQTSNIAYTEWIYEEGIGSEPNNGDLYYVETTQYAADAPDYVINPSNYREAYTIAVKQILGFVK